MRLENNFYENIALLLLYFFEFVDQVSPADKYPIRTSYDVVERHTILGTYKLRPLTGPRIFKPTSGKYVSRKKGFLRGTSVDEPDCPNNADRGAIMDSLQNEGGFRTRPIGAPVSPMRYLIYDQEDLEKSAYFAATSCTGKRSTSIDKLDEYAGTLETIYVSQEETAPAFDTALFESYAEGSLNNYLPATGQCSPECYNYKAMMYHDNKAVGCATVQCKEIDTLGNKPGFFSVCHFGTASTYDYTGKAYNAGESCKPETCPSEQPLCNKQGFCEAPPETTTTAYSSTASTSSEATSTSLASTSSEPTTTSSETTTTSSEATSTSTEATTTSTGLTTTSSEASTTSSEVTTTSLEPTTTSAEITTTSAEPTTPCPTMGTLTQPNPNPNAFFGVFGLGWVWF